MPDAPRIFRPNGDRNKREARQRYDKQREADNPWRAMYRLKRWVEGSKRFLDQHSRCNNPKCNNVISSDAKDADHKAVCDHIIPHRGDKKLFWDMTNWQALCKRCHDRKTARGE